MRPWLIHLRPLFIPSDARETLEMVANGVSTDKFIDTIWDNRELENPRDAKSLCNWPVVAGPHEAAPPQTVPANVTSIKKARG
jgi:hypothetical protein